MLVFSLPMTVPTPPFPNSAKTNASGHLEVAGCDVVELAKEFGTPLIIYDELQVRENCSTYREAFSSQLTGSEIIYASKAFSCLALMQLMREEEMSVDVASGGELFIALSAGLSPERIYLHGNANSEAELRQAVESGVGHVILDSTDELLMLEKVSAEAGRKQPVLMRITPGIEAHTHDYIQTGKQDSKFGFSLSEDQALSAVGAVLESENLILKGFHCHIGSQIFALKPYSETISVMGEFMRQCKDRWDYDCKFLDIGGGLGIAYRQEDIPADVQEFARTVAEALKREMARRDLPMPHLAVEPGRSIVANAGLTAYEIETVKIIPGMKTYVAVNGGMSDNIRPILYGADYLALIADRPEADPTVTAAIAGKHCESGDVLVKQTSLPEPSHGDILVTAATGAYGYSMASNYNGQTRPAVVFVRDGKARVIIRRETYKDLINLQERLD
jgi:diaminopimelate decarboxylase